MKVKEFDFGHTEEGKIVKGVTITNGDLLEITVMSRGATLTSFKMKDRDGNLEECTLGFSTLKEYEDHASYYGATIGRTGNRIANGEFTIDGVTYNLAQNNGTNNLHGGLVGFDKVLWDCKVVEDSDRTSVIFSYVSKDGEEGFPGNLKTSVSYIITKDNQLILDYSATTDKTTLVNLTNHAYWNLSAFKENIHNHNLQIEAETYLPTDELQIPTGELKSVEGTLYDFRTLTKVADNIKTTGGYDHNFNLSLKKQKDPINRAYVEHLESGRTMEILTTEPGVQLYTGYDDNNFFCLETQMYPDAANQKAFDSTELEPGEEYKQLTIHKFSIK